MKKIIYLLTLSLFLIPFVVSAQDEPGKDHPMLSRMPDFSIDSYEQNFDAVGIPTGPEIEKKVEGQKTYINYVFNSETKTNPSELQVIRNYQNAVKALGGKTLYSNPGSDPASGFLITKNNKNIYVRLDVANQGAMYSLTIVEEEAMKQEVTANELYESLNKDGFVALYINFDNGKSEIKAESQEIINQIAEMLKTNGELKISIEGHTDNVGTPEFNKTLSLNRAKTVVNALVAKGIDTKRLKALGWGQEKPIADNRTEEGRGKNRRVEIVKF